jgi:serine/threonine protein kinase
MTTAGAILGTLQYMAPEQIDGVEADSRTDLFAFGCVLFEMLTGRKAFEGKTRASLLGAILKDVPPPVSQFASGIPPGLDRLVQTCLAKGPDDRWQTARDVHVRPFPDVDSGYWQVSSEGGGRPVWSRDGRLLFFIDMKVRLMSVPIRPGTTFQFGNPSLVLELGNRSAVAAPGRYYDVSPDGKRFLVIRNAISADSKSGAPQLTVILNWGDEVKRLVPLGR